MAVVNTGIYDGSSLGGVSDYTNFKYRIDGSLPMLTYDQVESISSQQVSSDVSFTETSPDDDTLLDSKSPPPPFNSYGSVHGLTNSSSLDKFKYRDFKTNTIPTIDNNGNVSMSTIDYNDYEDPTFLGFDLSFLKDGSPLFSNNGNASATLFLQQYGTSNNPSINVRAQILTAFINTFNRIFKFDTDEGRYTNTKIFYIENIGGLDKLNEKIVKYNGEEGDKITITLTEDISMLALYLAELYNNLAYDYRNQRYVIPENCLRFNMKIRISDMRDYKIGVVGINGTQDAAGNDASGSFNSVINKNISSQIYILRDCNFNFFNSQNHGADISIGGFGGGKSDNPASLKFDIIYKSIEREFQPLLQKNGLIINNRYNNVIVPTNTTTHNIQGLDNLKSVILIPLPNGIQNTNAIGNQENPAAQDLINNKNAQRTMAQDNLQSLKNAAGITDLESSIQKIGNKIKSINVTNIAAYATSLGVDILARIKNTLVNLVISEIRQAATIPSTMDPESVYTTNVADTNFTLQTVDQLLNMTIPTSWDSLKADAFKVGLNAATGPDNTTSTGLL